ncbi:hypothetical protein Fmac_000269 [Flemingia macrophylla]|uniref:Uncharacterized protein n=1 Tax=Flemingia macrophylla TaxID=520843 RepID=A0ABD1NDT3_9FABA
MPLFISSVSQTCTPHITQQHPTSFLPPPPPSPTHPPSSAAPPPPPPTPAAPSPSAPPGQAPAQEARRHMHPTVLPPPPPSSTPPPSSAAPPPTPPTPAAPDRPRHPGQLPATEPPRQQQPPSFLLLLLLHPSTIIRRTPTPATNPPPPHPRAAGATSTQTSPTSTSGPAPHTCPPLAQPHHLRWPTATPPHPRAMHIGSPQAGTAPWEPTPARSVIRHQQSRLNAPILHHASAAAAGILPFRSRAPSSIHALVAQPDSGDLLLCHGVHVVLPSPRSYTELNWVEVDATNNILLSTREPSESP